MTPVEKKLAAAMAQFDAQQIIPGTWAVNPSRRVFAKFSVCPDARLRHLGGRGAESVDLSGEFTVGDICKFVSLSIEAQTRQGDTPPASLKGAGAGSFEDLLMKEAGRLEAQELLTMSRYPVASVMLQGADRPMQVPSLPDFEGVFMGGQQFVIEAKVCSDSAFKITKDKLKPKQVKHLLTRARFGVPGFLLIHFNVRKGKTFYDPQFTVGIRILPQSQGGLPIWEKFASDSKGAYSGSIDRATAKVIGTVMEWHTPKQCRSPRPNLEKFFEAALAPGLEDPL